MTEPSPPPLQEPALHLDAQGLSDFLDQAFPPGARSALGQVVSVNPGHVRMTLDPTPNMLRPGGIVSGPTLMGVADVAAYAVILAHLGPTPMAVTNTLNITFLRGCQLAPIVADARLLKLGRRLATVDVRIWQKSAEQPVAQATIGYALP
jgi:uncharacterized protein (TIGR00369 family)